MRHALPARGSRVVPGVATVSPQAWGRGVTARIDTRDVPAAVLDLVDERQGGRVCAACVEAELDTPADEPLELDHKQPLSKGGDNHHMNLQWLCRSHNRGRGNRKAAPKVPRWLRRQRAR